MDAMDAFVSGNLQAAIKHFEKLHKGAPQLVDAYSTPLLPTKHLGRRDTPSACT